MTRVTRDENKWLKALLRKSLREYLETIGDMTGEEKAGLHEWVASGNSPHENPWFLYGESGSPMDYVAARRISEEMAEDWFCSSRRSGQEGLDGFQDVEEDIAF
jgi:hypothetical protein